MKIKAVIIDDEPLAQRIVEKYALDIPGLEVVATFSNAIEAREYLANEGVELIFLDINMPKLSGLDLLRIIKNPPLVIITTAYSDFALQGYELDVVDYLMKPFSFERFFKAVRKAMDMIRKRSAETPVIPAVSSSEDEFIFVKSNKKTFNISLNEILYIEGLGDYVKIYTTNRMIITYQSLKKIEELLPQRQFPRIHKSFIISLAKIDLIEGNQVRIRDKVIPIGHNFKSDFEKLIRTI